MAKRKFNEREIEERVIRRIEEQYLKNNTRNLYIALEGLNFIWDESEVLEVDEMYKVNIPIWAIASSFNRDEDEVAVLIMDRCRQGFLKPRDTGIYGIRN